MSSKIPTIGVTAEIEWHEKSRPPRNGYSLDAQNFEALRVRPCLPVMLPHEIGRIESYLDLVDGLFITGGGYQFQDPDLFPLELPDDVPPHKYQRTQFETKLVEGALERRIPLLAVCGGFQVLNKVLGGKLIVNLDRDRPSDVNHRQDGPYTEGSHKVMVNHQSILSGLVTDHDFEVNSLHRQGVLEIGPDARVAATAPDGIVEAIEAKGHPFALGIQWHLEFFITPNDQEIFRGYIVACETHRSQR